MVGQSLSLVAGGSTNTRRGGGGGEDPGGGGRGGGGGYHFIRVEGAITSGGSMEDVDIEDSRTCAEKVADNPRLEGNAVSALSLLAN